MCYFLVPTIICYVFIGTIIVLFFLFELSMYCSKKIYENHNKIITQDSLNRENNDSPNGENITLII